MFKLVAFAVLSAGLIYISRASLRAPRSHGFYRFFAWEFIIALFLLNVDVWFRDGGRKRLIGHSCFALVPEESNEVGR